MHVPTIEDAERICSTWNNFKLTEKQLMRVCIHPLSYRKRPAHIQSRHPLFKDVFDPLLAKKMAESEAELDKQKT
jgi:hypothetical protein